MNQYRRIVSYLYKYGNGKKGENTGFVRIDTRPEGIRLHVRIKDLRMMDEKRLKIYFYFHKENRMQLIFVDEFLCLRGNCEYKKMVLPDFTDGDFERMNGVIFLDEQGLLYGSCWDEREISEELLEREEAMDEGLTEEERSLDEEFLEGEDSDERFPEEQRNRDEKILEGEAVADKMQPEEKCAREMLKKFEREIDEKGIEEPEQTETGEKGIEKAEQKEIKKTEVKPEQNSILSLYPEIPFYSSESVIQAVEIHMEDIPKLPSSEWKLADNAFLKQAYEAAGHLLLGRVFMPNERTVWLLGVPGIYENREKYLAGIFGFSDYIPLEEKEYKTGGRGYWIRQIESAE